MRSVEKLKWVSDIGNYVRYILNIIYNIHLYIIKHDVMMVDMEPMKYMIIYCL